MPIPESHPQRLIINDEVHARPPEMMEPPLMISYLALYSNWTMRERDWAPLADLAKRFDVQISEPDTNHFSADIGPFRVKWERHTEFTRYTFYAARRAADTGAAAPGVMDAGAGIFAETAMDLIPDEWVSSLPGQVIMAAHIAYLDEADVSDVGAATAQAFSDNPLVAASIGGNMATVYTDFHIHQDGERGGFSRFLMIGRGMPPRQAGRSVQRLLEIDTYRIMALLALPVARGLTPFLTEHEQELANIAATMSGAGPSDEPSLLDRLTDLEAAIESRYSENHYRFSAATAYYDLVQRRIGELREERIQGLQMFREFTERRLAPAINTCLATASRLESLSKRVSRASQLLSTRVNISRQRQNQALLESMNRRAKLQLRLQQTVEGLSVAAITYYIVGLVGYAAKGAKSLGIAANADLIVAISIPVVVFMVAYGVRRLRRIVSSPKSRDSDPDLDL